MVIKILRILKEAFVVLFLYLNPIEYYKIRLGFEKRKEVLLRLRGGVVYILRPNTNQIRIVDEICRKGVYDGILGFVNLESIVIDIGANIGIFSIRAGKKASLGKVFCFEPEPRNFEILNKNIRVNNMESLFVVKQKAVADTVRFTRFYFDEYNSGGGSLYNTEIGKKSGLLEVRTTTLNDIFEYYKIKQCDVLKLDCEGAEGEILTSTNPEIFPKIKSMAIEWHPDLNKITLNELRDFLKKNGFQTDFQKKTDILYCKRYEQ